MCEGSVVGEDATMASVTQVGRTLKPPNKVLTLLQESH